VERSRNADRAARTMERLDLLGQIGRAPDQAGTTRPGLSDLEQQACELVASWLELEGMVVTWDAAGNLYGRLEGADPEAPEIWTGSHLDSVPDGGRFDGALGVLVALEAVAALAAAPRRSTLRVVVFRDEEGWRFRSGFFGSRAVCGLVEPDDLAVTDVDGTSVAEALAALGFAGPHEDVSLPGSYVEVHIEQGPVLERSDIPLGVVSAIAGMVDFLVEFTGEPGHAGTVPMADRRDAFVATAEFALRLRDAASELPGAVATVGEVRIADPAANVVPGRVRLTVDVRAPDSSALAALARAVATIADDSAERARCTAAVTRTWYSEPVPLSARVRASLRTAAQEQGTAVAELPSGAGHDAGVLGAAGVESAMLFVRSLNGGVSHRPDELTDGADVERAIAVLAGTLRLVDAEVGVRA
jgi:allantoate deiminase